MQRAGRHKRFQWRQAALSVEEMRRSHPPRLSNRSFTARQTNIPQMSGLAEFPVISHQELPAPHGAVAAAAGAVESHSDDRPRQPVFRHATCHVGVTVLHGDKFHARLLGPPVAHPLNA